MLVLSRKADQALLLGNDITVTVLAIDGDRVKLGIRAPQTVTVLREEIYSQIKAANAGAGQTSNSALEDIAFALHKR
jgi:carbon storage regulator